MWCAFKKFYTNQDEIKHENEQDKKILWIKRKESVGNNIINDNDKVFQYDKICDASQMRERDENNKQMFWKINNKIEENDQKIEKNDEKDERHDWKKI